MQILSLLVLVAILLSWLTERAGKSKQWPLEYRAYDHKRCRDVHTFQQTERKPAMDGLSSPSNLTDCLRSFRLVRWDVVTFHLALWLWFNISYLSIWNVRYMKRRTLHLPAISLLFKSGFKIGSNIVQLASPSPKWSDIQNLKHQHWNHWAS